MRLSELIRGMAPEPSQDAEVTGISYDSRKVVPGGLYVALIGSKADGHSFVPQAVAAGAVAVVYSREIELPDGVAGAKVEDTRAALSKIADRFYGHPSGRLRVIGITGTKGKTSTAYLVEHILLRNGIKCGLMGSLEHKTGSRRISAVNTTPESLDVARYMAEMAEAGCKACVMEASSHALQLGRVEDVCFDVGVLTNMGHDHMDFHLTYEGYLMAKARLFSMLARECQYGIADLKGRKTAVINMDDEYADFMLRRSRDAGARSIGYGLGESSFLRAVDIVREIGRTTFTAATMDGDSARVETRLAGVFSVYNCLAAMGAALAMGISLKDSAEAIASFAGVAGRFERVEAGQDFNVIVDFAHNPESLQSALQTAREMTDGRLTVVFGCCGNRDRTNRPWMARIAQELADSVIVTHDNPLDEEPSQIISDIKVGLTLATPYEIEPDRGIAIRKAVGAARRGDTVLIAGKGAETYQKTGQLAIHFDDREEAALAIKEMI